MPDVHDRLFEGIDAVYPVTTRDETVVESTVEVDTSGYDGNLLVLLDVETGTGTTPTLDMTIEHSHDGTTFAQIPAAALYDPDTGDAATFATVTDAADVTQILGVKKNLLRRYVRFHLAIAGTTPDFLCAAYLLAGTKYTQWPDQ